MSTLLGLVKDTYPANDDVGVPLRSVVTITLSGVDYDEDSLCEGFFLEGPDTDQFVGPGMILQTDPDNVSQGDLDDFLASPGRYGIALAEVTVSGVNGDTLVSLIPNRPLAANTIYNVNLTGVLESDGTTEIDGYVIFSFTAGSGSIEEVPASISTSVLSQGSSGGVGGLQSATTLTVVSTTPADHSIEVDPELSEIIIEFDKALDPNSVDNNSILVETESATDHPGVTITSVGRVATRVEVVGSQLKVKI